MTEEKAKRLVVSCTVTAVLFLFVLLCVLVYQLVSLNQARSRKESLEAEKQSLIEQIESAEDEIENRSTEWSIELEARKNGLIYPGDKVFKDE